MVCITLVEYIRLSVVSLEAYSVFISPDDLKFSVLLMTCKCHVVEIEITNTQIVFTCNMTSSDGLRQTR